MKTKVDDKGRWLVDKVFLGEELTQDDRSFLTEHLKTASDRFFLCNLFYCCRQLGERSFIPLLEPHLSKRDVDIASGALWVLCWLGEAERLKPYILKAADIGFPWDPNREVGSTALVASGQHLRTHRDRDLAQLLVRWTPPDNPDDLPKQPLPPGMRDYKFNMFLWNAGKGMGVAVGADPKALLDDDALYAACVKRFLAERQDG